MTRVILVLGVETGSSLLIGHPASLHDKLQAIERPSPTKRVSQEWPRGCRLPSTSMYNMCMHICTRAVSHT